MTIGATKVPTSWDELYVGRFLKAGLLKDKVRTLTIKSVFIETMPNEKDNSEKDRGIMTFEETPLHLALNRTNGESLKALFGKKVQQWVGHKVSLGPEMTKFGKLDVEAIRVVGSPEITSPIEIEIRMPKRKPQIRRLVPTGKSNNNPAPQPDPSPQPEVVSDPDGVVQSEQQEQVKAEEQVSQ